MPKKRSVNQVRGDWGEQLAASRFPEGWVIREIRPDFGLDLHLEVFRPFDDKGNFEATGEHFFAQVKTKKEFSYDSIIAKSRKNVTKFPLSVPSSDPKSCEIEVAKCSLDTSLLETVEAMGVAVPVLLLCADETNRKVFYVCLNDYIDKVLIPENVNYREQDSSTVYVPLRNVLDSGLSDFAEVEFLGRRSKLYAAFALFAYQMAEFQMGSSEYEATSAETFLDSSLCHMLETFCRKALALDIWQPLSHGASVPLLTALRAKYEDLQGRINRLRTVDIDLEAGVEAVSQVKAAASETLGYAVWYGRRFEEIDREARLPTFLAELLAE